MPCPPMRANPKKTSTASIRSRPSSMRTRSRKGYSGCVRCRRCKEFRRCARTPTGMRGGRGWSSTRLVGAYPDWATRGAADRGWSVECPGASREAEEHTARFARHHVRARRSPAGHSPPDRGDDAPSAPVYMPPSQPAAPSTQLVPYVEPRMPSFHGVGGIPETRPAVSPARRRRFRAEPKPDHFPARPARLSRGDPRSVRAGGRWPGHLGVDALSWRRRGRPRFRCDNGLAGTGSPAGGAVGTGCGSGLGRSICWRSRPGSQRTVHPWFGAPLRGLDHHARSFRLGCGSCGRRRPHRNARTGTLFWVGQRAPLGACRPKADVHGRGTRLVDDGVGAAAKPKPARKGPGGDDDPDAPCPPRPRLTAFLPHFRGLGS